MVATCGWLIMRFVGRHFKRCATLGQFASNKRKQRKREGDKLDAAMIDDAVCTKLAIVKSSRVSLAVQLID
jgi:hypothetical protein